MFDFGFGNTYKTPEQRERERQYKKHLETCAKKRANRKAKKHSKRN